MLAVPFSDIEKVWLQRGGPVTPALTTGIILGIGVGMAIGGAISSPAGMLILGNAVGVLGGMAGRASFTSRTSAELELKPYQIKYPDELNKLHEWSVFNDSLIFTDDINLLAEYSGSLRRLFPQKHFRFTFGINGGFNSIEDEMRDAISSSGLPPWEDFIQGGLGFEYLDFSWRFNQRWIIGAGIMSNYGYLGYAYYYAEYEPVKEIRHYEYTLNLNDFRFYLEYVFSPVNRFLTERTEFLVGGGLILSRPKVNFAYLYEEDPETGSYWYGSNDIYTIPGFQIRASAHVYLFRNLSISGGVEMNLYQNLDVPAVMPPPESQQSQPILNAHSLNYSTVRFRLGAHLYF